MPNHQLSFLFRLPTSAEYDEMLRLTDADNCRCHWQMVYTLCRDEIPDQAERRISRGFIDSTALDIVPEKFSNARLGFRPFLEFVESDSISNLPDGTCIFWGHLSLDGLVTHIPTNPVAPTGLYMGDIPKAYNANITIINNRFPHSPIRWIKQGNGLIADRVLLCKVSWVHLESIGLVKGNLVHLKHPGRDLYNPHLRRTLKSFLSQQ